MPEELPAMFLASAVAVAAFMLLGWVISLVRKDASIVDIMWGAGFVVVAWVAFAMGDGYEGRKWLITLLASAWGLRLSIYLFARNAGKGEDYRYQAMRRRWGSRFPIVSLVTVFALQGVLMWVISLPLQVAQLSGTPGSLTVFDYLGGGIWLVGFAFESIGDLQLSRFKKDPANAGKVMDRGLWRYTRHPNYFGDAVLWWGLFIIAAAEPANLLVIFSPIVMTVLLTRVSGVPLLEKSLVKRREGYEAYIARTSSFIPMPPKSDEAVARKLSAQRDA
jgi:steroid 5-alpha reductase family enzyme